MRPGFLTWTHRAISSRPIAAKNWIFPLDTLIWKLNRKSRKLFGVLDNQRFSRWIRWGGCPYWTPSIASLANYTNSCLTTSANGLKGSCVKTQRKLMVSKLVRFSNRGRQRRHLADTYKASSDQAFHQRSQLGTFCAFQTHLPPARSYLRKVECQSNQPSIHHFLPRISSPPVR